MWPITRTWTFLIPRVKKTLNMTSASVWREAFPKRRVAGKHYFFLSKNCFRIPWDAKSDQAIREVARNPDHSIFLFQHWSRHIYSTAGALAVKSLHSIKSMTKHSAQKCINPFHIAFLPSPSMNIGIRATVSFIHSKNSSVSSATSLVSSNSR